MEKSYVDGINKRNQNYTIYSCFGLSNRLEIKNTTVIENGVVEILVNKETIS